MMRFLHRVREDVFLKLRKYQVNQRTFIFSDFQKWVEWALPIYIPENHTLPNTAMKSIIAMHVWFPPQAAHVANLPGAMTRSSRSYWRRESASLTLRTRIGARAFCLSKRKPGICARYCYSLLRAKRWARPVLWRLVLIRETFMLLRFLESIVLDVFLNLKESDIKS